MHTRLLLKLNCEFDKFDEISFLEQNNSLIIGTTVSSRKSFMLTKRKNIVKIASQFNDIVEKSENLPRYKRKLVIKDKNGTLLEIQIQLNKSARLTMSGTENHKEFVNTIELNKEKVFQIVQLLNDFSWKGVKKMETIIKMSCIEEEEDCVKVLDCNDGENVAIQIDIEEQPNMVYLDCESAIKLAEIILNKYKK